MERVILLLGLALWTGTARGAEQWLEFSRGKVGETPTGFLSLVAGEGPRGEWKIVLDDAPTVMEPITGSSPVSTKRAVLAQVSRDRTDERFPLFIYDQETFTDFKLTTRFKIVEGAVERIAGVVFRFQDTNNFYYVRASAQSGTVYFFKVVDGERSSPIGSRTNIAAGVWHELAVECKGTQIRILFNGSEAMPVLEDRSFARGKVGFWTKSDAVSHFADTQIIFTSREILAQLLVRDAFRKYDRLRGLKIYAVNTNETQARIVASLDAKEVGQPAPKEEQDVLARGTIYYGKGRNEVVVTLPLRDVNGEVAAAVRVVMNTFAGQTEKNAIVRALPVVKMMEPRVQRTADLFQ
jgi:hypothetical protein